MNNINREFLNNVKSRFLPLPRNATEKLEHELNMSDFEIKKELGIGSFGKVCLVKHKKTKAEYALKIINKLDKINQEDKAYFNREVEIMYKLNHPNIIKLYSHFEDNNNCYILMQYIPKGSAYDLIPKNGKKQENLKLVASIIKDLLNALYYLHNMNPKIIHRDIKPENILLDENNKAYLIDFGWSNYLINHRKRNSICGSPFYLSPEMVNEIGHDETNDIWCIGVLLFELITGKVPFEGNDIDEVRNSIINFNFKFPSDINLDAKDLISKILKVNPNERLTIEKILSHNFIKKYYPNAVNELIKPNKSNYKVFVVSTDDPKTWNETETKQLSNNFIRKTYTFSSKNNNDKNILLNKINNNRHKYIKYETKNYSIETNKIYNDINNNNYHSINTSSNKNNNNYYVTNYATNNNNTKFNSSKLITVVKTNQNSNKSKSNEKIKVEIQHNNNYSSKTNNYLRIDNNNTKYTYNKTDKNIKTYNTIENDKFSILSKRYDSLKNEYESWKNKELEKLRNELKDIEKKISSAIRQNKSFSNNITNNYNLEKLKKTYDNLILENNELKGKIKNYSNYFKNNENKNNIIILDEKFKKNLDLKTQKDINNIIIEKDMQINKCKEEIKISRQKEKEQFSILINKYDRTLMSQERENIILKMRLKELERNFINYE